MISARTLSVSTVVIKLVLRLHGIITSELAVRDLDPTLELTASELAVKANTSELVDRVPTSELVTIVFSKLGSIFCFFSLIKYPKNGNLVGCGEDVVLVHSSRL